MVLSITTGTANTYKTLVTGAAGRWTNASSHVSLRLYTSTSNYGLYIAPIAVSVLEYSPENSTQLGHMFPYKSFTSTSATSATNSETWVKAMCYVYTNINLTDPYLTLSVRNDRIRHTITHEMGHALSIGHPADESVDSVMNHWNMGTYILQSFEIGHLIAKWGS